MNKFKITIGNKVIEFATEAAAQAYKLNNNLDVIIENFTEELLAQPIIVPQTVTPRQMRIALVMSGISIQDIENLIESLPEPQKSITRITWEYSTEFQRDNPVLNAMAPALGLTPEEIDQLFILASTL